jgi:hypothetical protein
MRTEGLADRFRDGWYTRAGVRTNERRMAEPDLDIQKRFFPAHLVPHLGHELLRDLAPEAHRFLDAQHLYQWLSFTTHFEVTVVNRATQRIAEGDSGLQLPVHSRMSAFQIYIDEGYHSLYNLDVRDQLEMRSGIPALPFDFEPFLSQLDDVGAALPRYRRLVELLQVVVFETLITSILVDIPGDRSVIDLVRDTVRDHAVDEGRHHVYFADFFQRLWGQLDAATRQLIGPFLPELIVRSLHPNLRSHRLALTAAGFGTATVEEVLRDCYGPVATLDYIRKASARTVRLFVECDVLDEPGARDRFHELGLL